MFRVERQQTGFRAAARTLDLIYHNTVRSVRRGHSNALLGLLSNIFQTLIFIGVFYVLARILGMRAMAIRGDYILYLMTGIFTFMINTKTMGAVAGAEGPASPMMQHAPMTTAIAITSAALAALYTQVLSMVVWPMMRSILAAVSTRFRSATSKRTRETKTAVKRLMATPIQRVTANPLIWSEPMT
jgi:ABC-type polysaccharide/polyol phosphate export permease